MYPLILSLQQEAKQMKRQEQMVLNYPIFDGEKVIEAASVVIENGVITAVEECGKDRL